MEGGKPSHGGTSRMMREYQVRICERLGVKFLGPTRHSRHSWRAKIDVCPLLSNRVLNGASRRTQSWSSRPEEFHLQALPEPCVNLSIHTAPDVRPLPCHSCQ